MYKFTRFFAIAGTVALLGGCTGYESFTEVEALNEAQAVGNPFTRQLAGEYRTFANRELKEMFDYPDALHFARKGLAAAAGEVVMPEPTVDWNLLPEHIEELGSARDRLISAFDVGSREFAPVQTAIAQARYDCWIEQQEENWQADEILGCKSAFMEAMNALEAKVGTMAPPPAPEPEPETMVPPPVMPMGVDASQPMAKENAMYLVFFDWDSSRVGSGGNEVLDAVADEIRARGGTDLVRVTGHADTSGPRTYNRKLSLRRANTIRDELIKRDIDPDVIRVESKGEEELLVDTADNVREPANRRANISFE